MADEIKVKVKFNQDYGTHKKGSTKTVSLAEARRLRWSGVATQEGSRTDTKSS